MRANLILAMTALVSLALFLAPHHVRPKEGSSFRPYTVAKTILHVFHGEWSYPLASLILILSLLAIVLPPLFVIEWRVMALLAQPLTAGGRWFLVLQGLLCAAGAVIGFLFVALSHTNFMMAATKIGQETPVLYLVPLWTLAFSLWSITAGMLRGVGEWTQRLLGTLDPP
jgi:hypothetical protein